MRSSIIRLASAVPLGLRDALRANPLNVPFFGDVPNLTHSGLRRNALRASAQAGQTGSLGQLGQELL